MLGQCLRRWVHIVLTLGECFLGQSQRLAQSSPQTRGVEPMLFKFWVSVVDGGPTLKQHRDNVSCLLG